MINKRKSSPVQILVLHGNMFCCSSNAAIIATKTDGTLWCGGIMIGDNWDKMIDPLIHHQLKYWYYMG